jgi:hypothetical protein
MNHRASRITIWFLIGAMAANLAACSSDKPNTLPTGSQAPGATQPGEVIGSDALASRILPNGATAAVDDATWALADRLDASAYTSDTTNAMTEALARGGVGTFADTTGSTPKVAVLEPRSPFELLDFQTHALAVGAWASASWSGAQLDQVLPLPGGATGLAPTSAVLAGYVAAVDTRGAQLARALMAGQNLLDPATLQFPGVVLVLFATDIANEAATEAGPSPSPSPVALVDSRLLALAERGPGAISLDAPVLGAGICSATAAWIQDKINRLFDALKVAAPTNIIGRIVAAIWNWVVDRLQDFVQGLITSVTDLVLNSVRTIARGIAIISEQVASVLPYAVTVDVTGPTGSVFDLTTTAGTLQGSYVVSVSAGDLPAWPDILQDCAKVAGIELPDFRSKNVPLTWEDVHVVLPGNPLMAPLPVSPTDATTDDSGRATWAFQVGPNPGDPAGPYKSQLDVMDVAVHRPELGRVREALTNALLGFIPTILRPYVAGLLGPMLDGAQERMNSILDVPGKGEALIEYRDKVPATPVPAPATPTASTMCSTTLPAGTYSGTITTDNLTQVATVAGDPDTTTDEGSGPVTLTVAADGTLSGNFSVAITTTEIVHIGKLNVSRVLSITELGAGISGTVCTMVIAYASSTTTACQSTSAYLPCGKIVGQTVPMAGVVPPLPLPLTQAAGTLTWAAHTSSDDGSGDSNTSSVTVTLNAP